MHARQSTALVMALLTWGCASGNGAASPDQIAQPSEVLRHVPKWMTSPPSDPNYLLAPATATSKDLQLAIDIAQGEGRNGLAQQLEVKFQGLTKRFQEQTGVAADADVLQEFTSTWKGVVDQELVGSRARDETTESEGPLFRAYVLMEMPVGKASEALLERIKASQQMYTRFRAAQAFQELNDEVAKYEGWKKAQGGT